MPKQYIICLNGKVVPERRNHRMHKKHYTASFYLMLPRYLGVDEQKQTQKRLQNINKKISI